MSAFFLFVIWGHTSSEFRDPAIFQDLSFLFALALKNGALDLSIEVSDLKKQDMLNHMVGHSDVLNPMI